MSDRPKLLALYKQLLREGKRFPSIKRDAMLKDIQQEWRDCRGLTDPKKIKHAIEIGMRGLDTMRKYTSINPASSSWSVTLEQDPLGAGEAQARDDAYAQNTPPRPLKSAGRQRTPLATTQRPDERQFEPFGSSKVGSLE